MFDPTRQITIELAEGISFPLQLAGPMTRFLAWLIDLAVIMSMVTAVNLSLGLIGFLSADLADALKIVSFFLISTGYFIFMEWIWRGQTIGKRLLRLRVLDVDGFFLTFSQIAIRNLMRLIDMLPLFYLVGGIAMLANRRAQRLGDLAANTIVVRQRESKQPDLDQLGEFKFNSLRNYPHLEARLRQNTSPEETYLAFQALLRRNELEPAARIETFAVLAAHFRAKTEFPPDAVEGIADEQYLRNVVDVLFRPKTKKNKKC